MSSNDDIVLTYLEELEDLEKKRKELIGENNSVHTEIHEGVCRHLTNCQLLYMVIAGSLYLMGVDCKQSWAVSIPAAVIYLFCTCVSYKMGVERIQLANVKKFDLDNEIGKFQHTTVSFRQKMTNLIGSPEITAPRSDSTPATSGSTSTASTGGSTSTASTGSGSGSTSTASTASTGSGSGTASTASTGSGSGSTSTASTGSASTGSGSGSTSTASTGSTPSLGSTQVSCFAPLDMCGLKTGTGSPSSTLSGSTAITSIKIRSSALIRVVKTSEGEVDILVGGGTNQQQQLGTETEQLGTETGQVNLDVEHPPHVQRFLDRVTLVTGHIPTLPAHGMWYLRGLHFVVVFVAVCMVAVPHFIHCRHKSHAGSHPDAGSRPDVYF